MSWYLTNIAITSLTLLTALAGAVALDYWLSTWYNWRLDLIESLTGYGLGLIAVIHGVYFLGINRSILIGSVALVVTIGVVIAFEKVPENGGEPDGT